MARGGYRAGAGRKPGLSNKLTQELRGKVNAEKLINFLQSVVAGKDPEATVSLRLIAASALLRKVIPDCKQIDLAAEGSSSVIVLTEEHARSVIDAYHGK